MMRFDELGDEQADRFEIGRDLLCVADVEGRFISLNAAWEQVLGWSREELMARPFIEFVHPDDRERTGIEAAKVTLPDHELADFENRYRTKDGGWRWLRWSARSDGEVWFAVAFDVTAEREEGEALRLALTEERMLAYGQPIRDTALHDARHDELLVRLRPGSPGPVMLPAEFVPAAEHHGLIPIVDRWMIEKALGVAAAGGRAQVNVSGRSLANADFTRELIERMGEAGDAAGRVIFEITETSAIAHLDAAHELAERLLPLGCRFALDDFGTGYSSLTYLRELPFQYLKIDASHVRDICTSREDRTMLRAVVAFTRELGLLTVAEGVEDEETLALLRESDVDHVQGYLIGRPRPLHG